MKKSFAVLLVLIVAISIAAPVTVSAASVDPIHVEDWQSGDADFECGQVECCNSTYHYKIED